LQSQESKQVGPKASTQARKQIHRSESRCAGQESGQFPTHVTKPIQGKRYTPTIEIANAYPQETRNIAIILQILRISSIATMNPFIHLPDYHVIICVGPRCKYAVLPIHVDSHLSNARHNYSKEQREQVIQEINQIEGLIQDTRGLQSFKFPKPSNPAIPELKPAKKGLQCIQCGYICCNRIKMRDHCKNVHDWVNNQKKGRPSYTKRQSKPEQPWISGIHCQQFFAQGSKKQLFEVLGEGDVEEREAEPDMWAKVQKMTAERLEHIEKKAKEKVEEADENAEPNPWLKRVGWVRHLKEKDPERLRAAIEPPDPNEESELQVIIESFSRVVSTAQCIAVPERVGISALFEVNRKTTTQKPAMPFSSSMGEDTLKKYRGFWEQLLCYTYRMQEDKQFQEARPGYKLTRPQQNAWKALVRAADDITDRMEAANDRTKEVDDRTEEVDDRTEADDRTESPESIGRQERSQSQVRPKG
jgi:hypothetical protein